MPTNEIPAAATFSHELEAWQRDFIRLAAVGERDAVGGHEWRWRLAGLVMGHEDLRELSGSDCEMLERLEEAFWLCMQVSDPYLAGRAQWNLP